MMLSLLLSGSVALLAGGGSFAVTRSHYQRKIRALEARLRELRRALREREEELEATQAELQRLRQRLDDRERRLQELTESIGALRDLTVDLDRRLADHERFSRRLLAALRLQLSEHRREGEDMRQRLVHSRRSMESFSEEETDLRAEIVELQDGLPVKASAVEQAEGEVRESAEALEKGESELRQVLGA